MSDRTTYVAGLIQLLLGGRPFSCIAEDDGNRTVAGHPRKELAPKTRKSILRQARFDQ